MSAETEDVVVEWGSRLRQVRVDKKIGQEVAADTLGVSAVTLRYWEQGKRQPDPSKAHVLHLYMGVELGELIDSGWLYVQQTPDAVGDPFQMVFYDVGDESTFNQPDGDVWFQLDVPPTRPGSRPRPTPSHTNIAVILDEDPRCKGQLRLDEWSGEILYTDHPINDVDIVRLKGLIDACYGFTPTAINLHDGILDVAASHAFNPVKAWLDTLTWDGKKRLDTVLIKHCGAKDTKMNRLYSRKTFMSIIARGIKPGCKVDTMLIMTGKQGCGKSTFISRMVPKLHGRMMFIDTPPPSTMDTKQIGELLQGVWIAEYGELADMRKADQNKLKGMLTRRSDKFRPAYGKTTVTQPRTAVFVGSTNSNHILIDQSGSRRFWVVSVGTCDHKWMHNNVEQVLAEAAHYWIGGEPHWLDDVEEDKSAALNDDYTLEPTWVEHVNDFLLGLNPDELEEGFKFTNLSDHLRAKLGKPPATHYVADHMRGLGFVKRTKRIQNEAGGVLKRSVWSLGKKKK